MTAVERKAVQQGGMWLIGDTQPQDVFTPEDMDSDLKMMGDATHDFVWKEVMPKMAALEAKEEGLNAKLLRAAGELGLTAVEIPEEYGGMDLPKAAGILINEKLAPTGGFGVTYGAHQSIGSERCLSCITALQSRKPNTCPNWLLPK